MEILEFFEKLRTPFLTSLFSLITRFGEEYAFLIFALAVMWCVNKKYGYCMLFCGIVGQSINQFFKFTCKVERPWVAYPHLDTVESAITAASGYSFPSGHTQVAVTTYGPIAYFYKEKKSVFAFFTILTLLIATSRLYLGVHYMSDVVFSLIIGVILVVSVSYAFDKNVNTRIFQVITLTLSTALLIYFLLCSSSSFTAEEQSALKFSSKFFGASLAFVIAWIVDEKYLNFSTKGTFLFQLFKLTVGAGGVIALRMALKTLFSALSINTLLAHSVRYFIMVIFAGIVWPFIFNKIYQNSHQNDTNCEKNDNI